MRTENKQFNDAPSKGAVSVSISLNTKDMLKVGQSAPANVGILNSFVEIPNVRAVVDHSEADVFMPHDLETMIRLRRCHRIAKSDPAL